MGAQHANVLLTALARWSFRGGARERLWMKIGRTLRSTGSISVTEFFKAQHERAVRDGRLIRIIYGNIARALESGQSIGQALARYATYEEVILIGAADRAGDRERAEGFIKAAELMARKRQIRGMLFKQLSYPVLLVIGIIAFLCVIATYVVPLLAALSPPENWTGAAAALYAISGFVCSPAGMGTGIGIVLLCLLVSFSMPRWTGRLRDIADRLPPWSIYRIVVGVSWLYATAIMLSTNAMKLEVILRTMLEDRHTTPYLRSHLRPLHASTIRGLNFGDALWGAKSHWPDANLADDFRDYSRLSTFNQIIGKVVDDLMTDSMEKIQKGASILGILALFGIVVVIALLVAGIFGIQDQITSSIGG